MKPLTARCVPSVSSSIARAVVFSALVALALPANADLAADLAAATRSEDDRARDAGRKPAEVLAWLSIGNGMTVMDLIASGGWYTEVLSIAVEAEGTVYAQNPPIILQFRDGAYDKEISARLAGNRLGNVVRLDRDLEDTGLMPGSLDAAITALNFHDLHNRPGGDEVASAFLAAVKTLLKPGGVLGLIDHYGEPDQDNTKLHRLNVETALPIIQNAGFELTSSELLSNADDDHTTMVFDPAIRGKTDRVLYKLTKPLNDG